MCIDMHSKYAQWIMASHKCYHGNAVTTVHVVAVKVTVYSLLLRYFLHCIINCSFFYKTVQQTRKSLL